MRPQRKIPESDLETIKLGLKQAKMAIEYRHTHVLYLIPIVAEDAVFRVGSLV